jgi:hypothetical protein
LDTFSIKIDIVRFEYSLVNKLWKGDLMKILKKVLKIFYLLFWSVGMFLIVVSVVISEMEFSQKIVYVILTLLAYIAVLHLFKGEKND